MVAIVHQADKRSGITYAYESVFTDVYRIHNLECSVHRKETHCKYLQAPFK